MLEAGARSGRHVFWYPGPGCEVGALGGGGRLHLRCLRAEDSRGEDQIRSMLVKILQSSQTQLSIGMAGLQTALTRFAGRAAVVRVKHLITLSRESQAERAGRAGAFGWVLSSSCTTRCNGAPSSNAWQMC